MKPCLIIKSGHSQWYIAYDENGSMVAHHWPYSRLIEILRSKGYSPVPANSRCGRTIHDKVKGQLV